MTDELLDREECRAWSDVEGVRYTAVQDRPTGIWVGVLVLMFSSLVVGVLIGVVLL